MKRITILITMLLVLVISACNDKVNNDKEMTVDPEETAENMNYDKISAYMEEECKNTFSPYYELLDFEISNYEEEVVNGNVEAVFFL